MFDNYPSPEGYIPNNLKMTLPQRPICDDELPRAIYNAVGKFIGYSWRFGDTLEFEYKIDDYIKDNLDGKNIRISIVNFKRCEVFTTEMNASETISFPITMQLAEKLIRGIYYISFTVYDDESSYSNKEYLIDIE